MIKSCSALAIMLVLGASVVALPGFAPQVKADEIGGLSEVGPASRPIDGAGMLQSGLA